jgi:hypothetical protein
VLLYGAAAMSSNLNLGLRHVLPIYPFAFVAIGIAGSRAWMRWGRPAMAVTAVFALALSVESSNAFPNYIPFFNALAGGSRGGLELLADSNLDWGQDLKLLADWQARHRDRRLYLCYFGTADPRFYGIEYTNMPRSYAPNDLANAPPVPGVLAISARHLQGVYLDPSKNIYVHLRNRRPLEVLGGSIYLYAWSPAR